MSDDFSGKLIYLMVIFSPWAFGTTQAWSIWTMNGLGYLLGIFFGIKLAIRKWTGYRPARWIENNVSRRNANARLAQLVVHTLAVMTILILAYCLLGVVNARSTYHREAASFEYHPFISWLPNSHDRHGGWLAFCNYLALALSFWALRDWLLGKSISEERTERSQLNVFGLRQTFVLPERLRRLLWVLCINGGLLGIECIVQRLADTNKLLFVMETRINKTATDQFGPFAYRSNAAQYFNLVWPACLGLWCSLRRSAAVARHPSPVTRHLILICVMIMAAAPIISSTRAGAIVAFAEIVLAAGILCFAGPQTGLKAKAGILLFAGLTLGFGAWLGWATLAPRLEPEEFQSSLAGRNEMYETARQMSRDYPVFGTGPGTFEPLFQLYRVKPGRILAGATAQRLAANPHHLRMGGQRADRHRLRMRAGAVVHSGRHRGPKQHRAAALGVAGRMPAPCPLRFSVPDLFRPLSFPAALRDFVLPFPPQFNLSQARTRFCRSKFRVFFNAAFERLSIFN